MLPYLIWVEHPEARTIRAGRTVTLLRDTRAPPVALSGLAAGSKDPVLSRSAETQLPRPLEKENASTRLEVLSIFRNRLRPPGLLPFGCSDWPPARSAAHGYVDAGMRGPAPIAVGLSLSP